MVCSGEMVQLGFLSLRSAPRYLRPRSSLDLGSTKSGLWCKLQIVTSAKLLHKKQRLEAFAYDSAVSHVLTGYTNFSVIIDCATLALGSTSQWINRSSLSWHDWLEDYRADQEHRRPFYEMGRWQRNQNKARFPTCIYHRGHQFMLGLALAQLVTCIKT